MSQRFSFAGLMICCGFGGALYLGLIYPIFRLFDHSHGSGLANRASGQVANYSNKSGFGPGWICQNQRGLFCIRQSGVNQDAAAPPAPVRHN
jgi:hypothetical protein